MKINNPSDIFITVYKNVAAVAAEYELRLRLLANCTKELEQYKSDKLYKLEEKFIAHFSSIISNDEKQNLNKYRQLRNKLLHVEFKEMLETLSELKPNQIYESKVRQISFKSNEPILDQLINGIEDAPKISNVSTYDSFGWLMNCCINGIMGDVANSMLEAIEIINRCHDHNCKQEPDKT